MIKYIAHKVGKSTNYTCLVTDSDGNILSKTEVIIPLFIVTKKNFIYFILFDDHGKVIHPSYRYLNKRIIQTSPNSRKQSANAIRLLYCWLALTNYDIYALNQEQIDEMISFFRGLSFEFDDSFSNQTIRSNNTVNVYLATCRNYMQFLGIENSPLYNMRISNMVLSSAEYGVTSAVERVHYTNNLPTPNSRQIRTVPKYISPDDFHKLFSLAAANNDKTAIILMHLMYGYGLRLGECLGLTLEDIQEVHRNNNLVPILIIRNRMSDNPKFQSAKGKMNVQDQREYKTSDYQHSKDEIIITYDFYEQLCNYINETHEEAYENYPENYSKGIADIVSLRNRPDTNHYVFLNQYGKVLSDATWNNHLKSYFLKAGLHIDYDTRNNNLSHRFRHGFAMFHTHYSEHQLDALQLQKLMRHTNITSTMIYYNPTPEDEYQIKTEAQQYLYDQIPELKDLPF